MYSKLVHGTWYVVYSKNDESPLKKANNQFGQSLIELVVVIAVLIFIVGALTFATIASIRNAQFSINQSQATKLAQEGIEKLKVARDRSDVIEGGFIVSGNPIDSWADPDLWSTQLSLIPEKYFFTFDTTGPKRLRFKGASAVMPALVEDPLGDGRFKRAVVISDEPVTFSSQKNVTVIVSWTDFSGSHESRLSSKLGKL